MCVLAFIVKWLPVSFSPYNVAEEYVCQADYISLSTSQTRMKEFEIKTHTNAGLGS